MEKQTKIYTYRYFWEHVDGSCSCRYLSGTAEEHTEFQVALRADMNIRSAMREYMGEVDVSFIGFTEAVKEKVKDGDFALYGDDNDKKKDVPVNILPDTSSEFEDCAFCITYKKEAKEK